MSTQQPLLVSNKSSSSVSKAASAAATSNQISSPAASQTQQFFSSHNNTGSAASARNNAPRNNQSSKPKHKHGKRFTALDEDAEAEAFSMQNPHGRRGQQSITHLMQFALPPRPTNGVHGGYGGRSGGGGARHRPQRNPTWGLGSGYHSTDKARYIHANYRFIVDPRTDCHAQATDADILLDWADVLQVVASSQSQAAACPICLSDSPTAPRMAKCGHIFCLSCLIRYMHSEDASAEKSGSAGAMALREKQARWKKCPICLDSVYVSETRPVRWYTSPAEANPPCEGGDMVLRLVTRKFDSTLAMPRESADTTASLTDVPWYFAAEVMDYARVMKGSEEYMLAQYDECLQEIERQQREDELMFNEDDEWTRRAARFLREAKEKTRGIGNAPVVTKKPEITTATVPMAAIQNEIKQRDQPRSDAVDSYFPRTSTEDAASSVLSSSHTTTASDNVPKTIHELRQRQNAEKPPPASYLFYQGLPHYYLSPLDIRILKAQFGSYAALPSSLLPRVERVSSGHIVDDELRRRVKYLGHLPHGCEVAFLECDWRDVVSPPVLANFRAVLDKRRRKNEEREAREEKDRVRSEKLEEREMWGRAAGGGRRRPSIPNDDAFFSTLATPNLATSPIAGASSAAFAPQSVSPPFGAGGAPRHGFASLAAASPGTSPNATRTVWGTVAAAPSGSPDLYAAAVHASEEDGWLQGWEKDLLLEEELVRQGMGGLDIDGGDVAGTAKKNGGAGAGAGGGKKGKKGKKITLMSTGTNRRGA